MRKRSKNKNISVHAIAGTEVVLLGLNATEQGRQGLLGFSIYKRKGKTGKFFPLGGGSRTFQRAAEDDDGGDSKASPIQSFMWSDYVVDPDQTYTYRVVPVYGKPGALKPADGVEVTIRTESTKSKNDVHAVYFNRGVAGSQAYSKYFGKYRRWYLVEHGTPGDEDSRPRKPRATEFVRPEDVPKREAYEWLSRGLEEAMLEFIGEAKDSDYSIRAAVYEFTHEPAIQAFVSALERGADVKIVHHAKRESLYKLKQNYDADTTTRYTTKHKHTEVPDPDKPSKTYKNREVQKLELKDSVCSAADAAVSRIGLNKPHDMPKRDADRLLKAFDEMMIERKITQISHNKFIVLLHKGKPVQVWTGSTNFTGGGIYGQSNVGHVVRDPKVAKKYFDYWKKLATDPKKKSGKNDPPDEGLQNWNLQHQPDLVGPPPPNSITTVFSPRLTKTMLDWYAERLDAAKHSVFFTAAFSVATEIFDIVKDAKKIGDQPYEETPYLRYLLLEGIGGLLKDKYPVMAECPQNRIAWGDTLRTRKSDDEHRQFIETLTGLNDHVNYLHTKYMLVDPLSDDPIVISGSANFSKASTQDNDENMLIIRGNTRVADIYLGEFMRLFNHFRYRNVSNKLSDRAAEKAHYLKPNDSWTGPYYTAGSQEMSERLLFA